MKLFIILFLSLNINIYAQEGNLKNEALTNINFMTEDYPPFNYFYDGKVSGFGVDIIVQVFNELKVDKNEKNIRILPWARGYRNVQKMDIGMLFF